MFGFGKAKQEAWTGVVVRKGSGPSFNDGGDRVGRYYTLDVKRDDNGKTKHFIVGRGQVSAEIYNSLSEGDKVAKAADTTQLQKS